MSGYIYIYIYRNRVFDVTVRSQTRIGDEQFLDSLFYMSRMYRRIPVLTNNVLNHLTSEVLEHRDKVNWNSGFDTEILQVILHFTYGELKISGSSDNPL